MWARAVTCKGSQAGRVATNVRNHTRIEITSQSFSKWVTDFYRVHDRLPGEELINCIRHRCTGKHARNNKNGNALYRRIRVPWAVWLFLFVWNCLSPAMSSSYIIRSNYSMKRKNHFSIKLWCIYIYLAFFVLLSKRFDETLSNVQNYVIGRNFKAVTDVISLASREKP